MTSPPHRHDASQNVASFACICQFAYFVLLFITFPSCSGPWTWIIAFCSFLQHLTEDLRKRFVSLVFGGELSKWLSAARRFSSAARIELMPQKHGQPSASPQICFITIDRIYKAQHCHTALDENYSMYSENIKYYQTHSKPASTACVRTCCLLRFSPTKLHRAAFLLFIFGIQILSKPGSVVLQAMVLSFSLRRFTLRHVAPPSLSRGEELPKEAPTRTIRISRLEPSFQHPHTGIGGGCIWPYMECVGKLVTRKLVTITVIC